MWTRPQDQKSGFYSFTDKTNHVVPVGQDKMPTNGHNTYLAAPYDDWILNDTYPDRADLSADRVSLSRSQRAPRQSWALSIPRRLSWRVAV